MSCLFSCFFGIYVNKFQLSCGQTTHPPVHEREDTCAPGEGPLGRDSGLELASPPHPQSVTCQPHTRQEVAENSARRKEGAGPC